MVTLWYIVHDMILYDDNEIRKLFCLYVMNNDLIYLTKMSVA